MKKEIDVRKIDRLTRLALNAPDDDLLLRFFEACRNDASANSFTESEFKWVTINLESNFLWQKKWQTLEEEAGVEVDWHILSLQEAHRPGRIFGIRFGTWQPTRMMQLVAGLALLFVVSYGTLWGISNVTRPHAYELAKLDFYKPIFATQLRSTQIELQSAFEAAINILFNAETDWLGLFPSYNVNKVNMAIDLLKSEYSKNEDPFKRAEIAFLLGKAHLMTYQVEDAKTWLQQVLEQNVADFRADAQHLLEQLAANE